MYTNSVSMLRLKYIFCYITDEPSQNGSSAHAPQNGVHSRPQTLVNQTMPIPISTASAPGAVPGPTTNLNIGMDYWGTPTSSAIPALHGKVSSTAVAGGMITAGSRDGVQSQIWLQVVALLGITSLSFCFNLHPFWLTFRTKESLKDKGGSSLIGNLHADPGYGSR